MKVQPIGAVLPAVLRQAATKHEALAALQRAWPKLVGRALATHTRPVGLRGGRLTVQADRPGDSFLLSYRRGEVLKRVQAATAGGVDELVVRPGGAAPKPRTMHKPCRT